MMKHMYPLRWLIVCGILIVFGCSDSRKGESEVTIPTSVAPNELPEGTTAIIGTISDWSRDNTPLSEALVYTQPISHEVLSRDDGSYVLHEDVRPDSVYKINAEKEGFAPFESVIQSRDGQQVRADMLLVPLPESPPLVLEPASLFFPKTRHVLYHLLRNTSEQAVQWRSNAPDWLGLQPSEGTLEPGATVPITFWLRGEPLAKASGSQPDVRGLVIFSNLEGKNRLVDAWVLREETPRVALGWDDIVWDDPETFTLEREVGDRVTLKAKTTASTLALVGAQLSAEVTDSLTELIQTDSGGTISIDLGIVQPGETQIVVHVPSYPDVPVLRANLKVRPTGLDTDNDTVLDGDDNCPQLTNTDQQNSDDDLFGDVCDNCPNVANPNQDNVDDDELGDACDDDNDNDTIPEDDPDLPDMTCTGGSTVNCTDNCPLAPNPDQADFDSDAIGDICDPDDDNDTVDDAEDNCSLASNADQNDADNDTIGDICDDDDDNDTIEDGDDNCPLTPNTDQANLDGDTLGDECDDDDDNDTIPEDGDGSGEPGDNLCSNAAIDCDDNCPLFANADQRDSDNDMIGDACDNDDDNDTIPDLDDNCPFTPNTEQINSDNDMLGDECDNDDDNDTVPDGNDNCIFTPNTDQADLDNDGIGDLCEGDIDGDDAPDSNDNCRLIPNADQRNSDDDMLGDACDNDDDNDTIPDLDDNCSLIANTNQLNTDNDAFGNACDDDADNDGIPNDGDNSDDPNDAPCVAGNTVNCDDNCPLIQNPNQANLDSDPFGDFCDTDIDNDGVFDDGDNSNTPGDNTCQGGNIVNCDDNCVRLPNALQSDIDTDGLGDICDPDSDGDTILNDGDGSGSADDNLCSAGNADDCDDNCPLTPNVLQRDLDGDGIGNTCEADIDGDGILEDGDNSNTPGDAPCAGGNTIDCDDNCPARPNADQADANGDGIGDICQAFCSDSIETYEPNETEETAFLLPGSGALGKICPGDQDWFARDYPDGCGAYVTLSWNTNDGMLGFEGYDNSVLQATGALEQQQGNFRTLGAFVFDRDPAPIALRVFATEAHDEPIAFNLSTEQHCGFCPDNNPNEPNNTFEEATLAEDGSTASGVICQSEQDWYAFELTANCELSLGLEYPFTQGDLDVDLIDTDGSTVLNPILPTGNQGPNRQLSLDTSIDQNGTYFARITNPGGPQNFEIPYDLLYTLNCCTDDEFELNNTQVLATPLSITNGGTQLTDLSLCEDDEDWFDLGQPPSEDDPTLCDAIIHVEVDSNDQDIDIELHVDGSAIVQDPILGDSIVFDDGNVRIHQMEYRHPLAEAVTLFAKVTAADGTFVPNYKVTSTTLCECTDDAFEPNNFQFEASDAPLVADASFFITANICDSNDDWYTYAPLKNCDFELALFGGAPLPGSTIEIYDGIYKIGSSTSFFLRQPMPTLKPKFELRFLSNNDGVYGTYELFSLCTNPLPLMNTEPDEDRNNASTLQDPGNLFIEPITSRPWISRIGDIEESDEDWFRVQGYTASLCSGGILLDAYIIFDSNESPDERLELDLYDEEGNEVDAETNVGFGYAHIKHNGTIGSTYYIQVRGATPTTTGQYLLWYLKSCELNDDCALNEPDDNVAQAQEIPLGTVVEGYLCDGDEDWFKLPLNANLGAEGFEPPNVHIVSPNNRANVLVDLISSLDTTKPLLTAPALDLRARPSIGSSSGVFMMVWNHPKQPGEEYFIRVRKNDTNPSEIRYLIDWSQRLNIDSGVPENEPNNSPAEAHPTATSNTHSGSLGPFDQDWYSLHVDEGCTLHVRYFITGSLASINVLDPNMLPLVPTETLDGDNLLLEAVATTSGTHYVGIIDTDGGAGGYPLTFETVCF